MAVNKQIYIDFLLAQFSKGFFERKELCSKFVDEFRVTSRTFDRYWMTALDVHRELRGDINERIIKEATELQIKALKKDLKTKDERIEILQNQVEEILNDLENGVVQYQTMNGLKERDMNPMEKATLRRTLREIQAEISKIEGDYAAIKTDMKAEIVDPSKIPLVTFKKFTPENE